MSRLSRRLLSFCLFAVLSVAAPARAYDAPPWASDESNPEDLVVTLVTFGPGPELISWWGHTALVVEDRRLQHARLYNYGMFSFDEGMLPRFALGRLEFWVGEAPAEATFRAYAQDLRDVRLQILNLEPAVRLSLAKHLANNVLPKNREYRYHHYYDNCSTRPRDVIDRALDGQLKKGHSIPGRMTLRDHTRRYTAVIPAMSVFLDFMMNDEIDKPIAQWDEAFLPDELERLVDESSYVDSTGKTVPLVAQKRFYFDAPEAKVPAEVPRYMPWLIALGLLLAAVPVGLGEWARRGGKVGRVLLGLFTAFVGLILGIPGMALVVMWLITDHTVTFHNANLLLANPLTLLSVGWGLKLAFGSAKAARRLDWAWRILAGLSLLAFLLRAVHLLAQDNLRIVALVLPLSAGLAAAFWRLERAAAVARAPAPVRPSP